jgi:hypothetical protein
MTMTLDIPDDLLGELSAKFDDVGQTALEALAAKAYEEGVLSLEQVRRLLDLPSRWEAEAVLKHHGVWPGTTVEDVLSDLEVLEDIRQSLKTP